MYQYKIKCQVKLLYHEYDHRMKEIKQATFISHDFLNFPNLVQKGDIIVLDRDGQDLEEEVMKVSHTPGTLSSVLELETKEAGDLNLPDVKADKWYQLLVNKYKFIGKLSH